MILIYNRSTIIALNPALVKGDHVNLILTDYKMHSIETMMLRFAAFAYKWTKFEFDMGKVIVSGHICTAKLQPRNFGAVLYGLISDELQRIRELIPTISFDSRCALMQNTWAT